MGFDIGGGNGSRGGTGLPYDPFPDEAAKSRRLAEDAARRSGREIVDSVPLPPDIADLVLRDATTGRVRRVRGGSFRESILGQAMALGPLVFVALSIWLRHLLRGE